MNKNLIITIVLILTAIVGFWIGTHSPWHTARPLNQPVSAPAVSPQAGSIAEQLIVELPCPDPDCSGRPVSQCTTKTARDMKRAIQQLAQAGLNRETILKHLRMMSYIPAEK
ncbi:MAG: hypothetical protein V2A61_00080 [Calditrichota bacterium]